MLLQTAAAAAAATRTQNFELGINRDNASLDNEETLLSNDIRGHIRPSLAAMKEAVVKRMHEARQQLLELLDAEEARLVALLLVHLQCNSYISDVSAYSSPCASACTVA
jgi:hypothetical protein